MTTRISSRFSLIKRIGTISFENFKNIMQGFIGSISHVSGFPIVEINLFSELPHSLTSYQEGLNEYLAEENKKLIFATYDNLSVVPQDAFQKARFIRVVLRTRDENQSLIEFKGFLPDHVVFHTIPAKAAGNCAYIFFEELCLQNFLS